ncbi:hypothetical protein Fmac_015794 [Flemingia macrophylla]|uniref:Pentatricopeptide repeat-containing protein n=1 Tax=Flemingia macrophylla TaxID=520843 RepID=A0ABD1MFM8_9FABA
MGYHPNNTLIRGLCPRGKLRKALHFHDDAMAQGFRFDQVTYGKLVNGLCKTGETKAGLEFLKKIEGRIDYVWDLVDEMHNRGQPVNIITYSSLLDALCKNCHLERAIALFKNMINRGIKPDKYTYTIIVDGLCKGGRLKTTRAFSASFD